MIVPGMGLVSFQLAFMERSTRRHLPTASGFVAADFPEEESRQWSSPTTVWYRKHSDERAKR